MEKEKAGQRQVERGGGEVEGNKKKEEYGKMDQKRKEGEDAMNPTPL